MIQDCRYFIIVVSAGQAAYFSIIPIAPVAGAGLHRLPVRMGAKCSSTYRLYSYPEDPNVSEPRNA